MKEQGWGRIINMSSVAGTLGGFGQASYSATKGGILELYQEHGPGRGALRHHRKRHRARYHQHGSLPDGQPEDEGADDPAHGLPAARRAGGHRQRHRFLCSDKAKYITGIGLNVSGGIELFTF